MGYVSAIDTTDNATQPPTQADKSHTHSQIHRHRQTPKHTHKYTERDIKHRNTNTKAGTKQNTNGYITKAHPGSSKLSFGSS